MFFWFFSLFLAFAGAATLKIEAPSTIYRWCIQPYIIKMDTDWISTKSIDVKMFLTGYFSIHNPYIEVSTAFSAGNSYANYIPWVFDTTNIQTGVANSGDNIGWQYLYINSSQLGGFWEAITGSNKLVATLYLKANDFDTGYLNFYHITGWNGDDSNISSGINEWIITGTYTLYEDALASVVNLEKAFSSSNACDSRPYIDSAVYRQTGYVSTSTWVKAVWTSVIAWPLYSWTNNWTIWTKEGVRLYLTWISDSYSSAGWLVQDLLSTGIKLTNVSILNNTYLSPINFAISQTGWSKQYYEILITGNVSSGFVWFDNILWNTGFSYKTWWNNYWNTFNIDVFWIDTVSPINTWYFTGYVSSTGVWITNYVLSWVNFQWHVSNPTSWFHASWTDMDDQYKVIWFSGTNTVTQNCTDLSYPCTETWYMQYLNSTGYVWSWNNIFKLEHNIVFTNSFSGYVTVIDRAGNTGEIFVDINMDDLIEVNYGIIAYTEAAWYRNDTSLSGMLLKIAIYSGWFDKEWLLGSGWGGIELVYTGRVKTSTTWWSDFTGNFASWQYWVLAEWVHTLSYLISGVSLNPQWWLIDFSLDNPSGFVFWDLNGITPTFYSATYPTDINRNQMIETTDLANLILIWARFNILSSNWYWTWLWVYTWAYFVDQQIWSLLDWSQIQSNSSRRDYMQYHPFDLDADGQITITDYNMVVGRLGNTWHTFWWRMSWLSSQQWTMPF